MNWLFWDRWLALFHGWLPGAVHWAHGVPWYSIVRMWLA
jgi:hypothetical protein